MSPNDGNERQTGAGGGKILEEINKPIIRY